MDLQHINIKIFVDGEMSVDSSRFIEVFHTWVAEQSMSEMMIDVADYRHVPNGPGVVMVGLEADYGMDNAGGQPGLLYNRKSHMDGSNQDRLRQAFDAVAGACERLEAEFASAGLKFSRQRFEIIVNDRALAPNTAETFSESKPDIEAFLNGLVEGSEFTLEHNSDARSRFTVQVQSSQSFALASGSAA